MTLFYRFVITQLVCLFVVFALILNYSGTNANGSDIDNFLRRMHSTSSENCSVEMLGPGVVQGLARDRFKRQALIAVARANLLTYLWKYNPDYLYRESVLYWLVTNLVESDSDIFAAGNCYDYNQFKSFGIFCPYAFRNKVDDSIIVKDLSKTHHYDDDTTEENEWFHEIRRIGLRIINQTDAHQKKSEVSFFLPNEASNKTYTTLVVDYNDGSWSMPYFDCGGGNIWMITYTVPFFGYDRRNRKYAFKGTSGIDIDLMQVDINQCPQDEKTDNVFADTDKCKPSTYCSSVSGLGFQRGSYKCFCRPGYYFPQNYVGSQYDAEREAYFFNGSNIEEEFDQKQANLSNFYDVAFDCIKCSPGCDVCIDDRPCLYPINWVLRIILLSITVIVMFSVFGWSAFVILYQNYKAIKAASPLLLQLILGGALLSYFPTVIHFFEPIPILCTLQYWPREIGFAVMYAAILFKTWRIAVVFRPTKYRNVRITDLMLLRRVGVVVGLFALFCIVRTILGRPDVEMIRHSSGMKTYACNFDSWDYSIAGIKLAFLFWGIWLSIQVHKTPSEFNESRFISWAIYNETILSLFFNVGMLFLHNSGNPDLFYMLVFLHSQLTVTGTTAFLFASKAFHLVKSKKAGENPRNKRRRFVPALNSRSSVTGTHFTSPMPRKGTRGNVSNCSHDIQSDDDFASSIFSPTLVQNDESTNNGQLTHSAEARSASVTAVDKSKILPKVIEKLQQAQSSTTPEKDNNYNSPKIITTPPPDEAVTLIKNMVVHLDINGIDTPSKSRSDSSCKSLSSGSNGTYSINSSHVTEDCPAQTNGDLDSAVPLEPQYLKSIVDVYPDLPSSNIGYSSVGTSEADSLLSSVNKNDKVAKLQETNNAVPNGRISNGVEVNGVPDCSIRSSEDITPISIKHSQKGRVNNVNRDWSKKNGSPTTRNVPAFVKQDAAATSRQMVTDAEKPNVVNCVHFTYV